MPDLWTKTGTNAAPVYERADGVKIYRIDPKRGWTVYDKAGNVMRRRQRYVGCMNPDQIWYAASLEQAKRGAAEVIPFLGDGK